MFAGGGRGVIADGKYKCLQLAEKPFLEIMFVLGTDTKHQCKQVNKQPKYC